MRRKFRRLQWRGHSCPRAFVFVVFLFLPLLASAGTLSGTVKNGTTGKPVARQTVVLLSLVGGMQEVTSVTTDSDGRYSFNRPEIGQGPLLVRVPYQNVNYHQAAPPGRDTVDITVFESSAPASAVHLASRTLIFQPNGPRLLVGEEFVLENAANPPATYANQKGTFEFGIPDGAELGQVSATGPGGMPVTQGTMDRAKNRFAVDYAIKPGETNFRVSYELPYSGDRASVQPVTLAPTPHIMIAAPVGVQVSGDGFAPAGTDQGFTLLTRDNLASGAAFSVVLSGAATAQTPSQGQPAQNGRDSGAAAAGAAIQEISPRLSSFQWIVLGGMGVFFLAGFFFLMRNPAAASAVVSVAAMPVAPGSSGIGRKNPRSQSVASGTASSVPSAATPSAASAVLDEADRGAQLNLEQLKDTLFRLELRRQAGTISDDDYARERSRIESILRDLVRG